MKSVRLNAPRDIKVLAQFLGCSKTIIREFSSQEIEFYCKVLK
tara:strand:+ start:116 stop:244 length:129 start_codon:yes stop_codon:yes gene_type:complete